jgi:phospholipid/cholesterol/gamma-HCH transport system ATP-binding protein
VVAEAEQASIQAPIECRSLGVHLGGRPVLREVDLAVRRGEILGVLGRSGSGKTTLLRCMVGLATPDEGDVLLFGQDLVGLSEDRLNALRRRVGMVFQSSALFDSLSVYENVAFYPKRFAKSTTAELDRLVAEKLELVDLAGTEALMPAELSGGMRKRVAIARALASEPEIILYDEPASGLDPIMCGVLDDVIRSLGERLGMTSVIVSHDVAHTFALADRVALLHDGTIYAIGEPQWFEETDDPLVRQFVTGAAEGPLRDAAAAEIGGGNAG